MAILASVPAGKVGAMTEIHKARNFINAAPLDLAVVLARVTLAAYRRFGQRHGFARIGVRMAGGALQLQVSRMQLMAERNGLRRHPQQKQEGKQRQRLPFRISSAM
jgi:hypothetical protein